LDLQILEDHFRYSAKRAIDSSRAALENAVANGDGLDGGTNDNDHGVRGTRVVECEPVQVDVHIGRRDGDERRRGRTDVSGEDVPPIGDDRRRSEDRDAAFRGDEGRRRGSSKSYECDETSTKAS